MKKAMSMLAVAAMLLATLSLAVSAKEGNTMTWTGWISDSGCAAKGANADHKECAIKCVKEKGASWVFVESKSKKVLNIHNQDAVSEDQLGHEVKLTGHVMDDGSLHVDSIAPAGGM